jgi:hypothetical protein
MGVPPVKKDVLTRMLYKGLSTSCGIAASNTETIVHMEDYFVKAVSGSQDMI